MDRESLAGRMGPLSKTNSGIIIEKAKGHINGRMVVPALAIGVLSFTLIFT